MGTKDQVNRIFYQEFVEEVIKLKYGKTKVNKLSIEEKEELLNEIIGKCVLFAGDSYEDFAQPVIKLLKKNGLVEYGD